jgi:hypothetical protein
MRKLRFESDWINKAKWSLRQQCDISRNPSQKLHQSICRDLFLVLIISAKRNRSLIRPYKVGAGLKTWTAFEIASDG